MPDTTTQTTTQSSFQSTSELSVDTCLQSIDKPILRPSINDFHLDTSTLLPTSKSTEVLLKDLHSYIMCSRNSSTRSRIELNCIPLIILYNPENRIGVRFGSRDPNSNCDPSLNSFQCFNWMLEFPNVDFVYRHG